MVRIFRITMLYSYCFATEQNHWLYERKDSFDRQWKAKTTGYKARNSDTNLKYIAEEVINGQWVEIDRWDNGKQ